MEVLCLQAVGDSDVRIGLNNNENEFFSKIICFGRRWLYHNQWHLSQNGGAGSTGTYYDDKTYDFVRGSERVTELQQLLVRAATALP